MKDFINNDYRDILQYNHLDNFEALWKINNDWYEEPNYHRGGWSGAIQIKLATPDGHQQNFFLKKQSHFCYRTLQHPLQGLPTLYREFMNIRRFQASGIDVLTPVFHSKKKIDGVWHAVLITKALDDYVQLDEFIAKIHTECNLPFKHRIENIKKIAKYIRNIHDHHYRYGSLYTKHIFVKANEANQIQAIRLIDLEKAKKWYFPKHRMKLDLSAFYTTVKYLSKQDALRFMYFYLDKSRLGNSDKKLIKNIMQRYRDKHKS